MAPAYPLWPLLPARFNIEWQGKFIDYANHQISDQEDAAGHEAEDSYLKDQGSTQESGENSSPETDRRLLIGCAKSFGQGRQNRLGSQEQSGSIKVPDSEGGSQERYALTTCAVRISNPTRGGVLPVLIATSTR